MFEDVNVLWWIIIPTIAVIVPFVHFYRWRINKDPNFEQSISPAKVEHDRGDRFMVVMLLFALPQTPTLSTFGYPKSIEDIQTPKQMLYYLQWYNHALVKTIYVLYWFIFTFVVWFLSAVYTFSKAVTEAIAERN
jgi:phosphate/sulfate permease